MSDFLSFLGSAQVEEVKGKARAGKQLNPAPSVLAIRVWKDGSVYPSQALVDKFNLEYQNATITKLASEDGKSVIRKVTSGGGNGFDVIDSRIWPNNKTKDAGAALFIGAVEKKAPKVDLFGSSKYDDEGKPLTKVMEQGTTTFGSKVLLPALEEVYGIKLGEDKPYVDLVVTDTVPGPDVEGKPTVINISEKFSTKITNVPKRVARGDKQGQADFERRENMTIYLLVPASLLPGAEYELSKAEGIAKQEEATASK